jgi:hypothetical protein
MADILFESALTSCALLQERLFNSKTSYKNMEKITNFLPAQKTGGFL